MHTSMALRAAQWLPPPLGEGAKTLPALIVGSIKKCVHTLAQRRKGPNQNQLSAPES